MQASNVIILSAYELVLALVFSTLSLLFATKLMNKFVLSAPVEWFIRQRHVSGCLISGTLVFSVVYLARGSVEQSTLAFQSLINANQGFGLKPLLIALAYFVVFYAITFFLSFLSLFIVSQIYRFIMREIDIDHQIEKEDNLALSIFLVTVLLAIISFVDKPINHMLGSLVFHEYIARL